jgi:NAD(P)H-dependent FMN reductase
MKILAISGSLRAASANSRVIEALPLLAPPGVEVSIYRDLGRLPWFNLDLEEDLPAPVARCGGP